MELRGVKWKRRAQRGSEHLTYEGYLRSEQEAAELGDDVVSALCAAQYK